MSRHGEPAYIEVGLPEHERQEGRNVYSEPSRLIAEALDGVPAALDELVDRLTPVIQARVRRSILRRRSDIGEMDPRELLKDLVQDVFLQLWKNDGATLRAWDASKGASLENFVGLVAERKVISHLRRGTLDLNDEPPEESASPPVSPAASPENRSVSNELLRDLTAYFRRTLSPLGWTLFELLFVWEGTVQEVSLDLGMKPDAVRKWRTRLRSAAHGWLETRNRGGPS